MKIIGIIPARYKSSRFPGKPLVNILNKPMIIHVCEKATIALGITNVYVATDDDKIFETVKKYGYNVIMTSDQHLTGTDRLAEVASKIDADIYINIQGDEPMINPSDITKIINCKINNMQFVINGMSDLLNDEDVNNINIPKVLVNRNNELIYMSRLAIPGIKSGKEKPTYKKQICVYAFTKEQLILFAKEHKKSEYESFEDIEILRYFDLGIKVKMLEIIGSSIAVDVLEDVEKVEKAILKQL